MYIHFEIKRNKTECNHYFGGYGKVSEVCKTVNQKGIFVLEKIESTLLELNGMPIHCTY